MSLFLRKHWKKMVLSCAAVFWASCGDDSTSSTQVEIIPDSSGTAASSSAISPESSESVPNSSAISPESSASVPSSSEAALPESSSSSNPKDTLKLASNTTITCRDSVTWTTFKFYTDTGDCRDYPDLLASNTSLSIEEIIQKEDEIENCENYAALYGVSNSWHTGQIKNNDYYCSDGKVYTHKNGNLVYTDEEYAEKFASSSSSASHPSPLCQKRNFVSYDDIRYEAVELAKNKLDSARATKDLSETKEKCLESVEIDPDIKDFKGLVAKKQICDGDTTMNERYQKIIEPAIAKIDSSIAACDKQ